MNGMDWFNLSGMVVVLLLGVGTVTMLSRRAIRSYLAMRSSP